MKTFHWSVLLTTCLFLPLVGARADDSVGVGVLGDSYSDEYQFYPPHRSTGRNWVELLAEVRGVNFGRFSTESRGEPRNQGYEFNWARSDATTEDLLATGQHAGLAAQVARGQVKIVVIFIGGNDFIQALESSDPASALDQVLPRATANYHLAVETILGAHPEVKLVVATIPDIHDLPEFVRDLQTGRISRELADKYVAALKLFNTQVRSIAMGNRRIALVDFDLMTRLANRLSRDYALVVGRKLDRTRTGNDLEHLFLNDERHLGTLAQGVMAQAIVTAINIKFSAGIAPINDREILAFAKSVSSTSAGAKAVVRLRP